MSWIEKTSNRKQVDAKWAVTQSQVDIWVKHYKSRLIKEANLESLIVLNPMEKNRRLKDLFCK